MTKSFVLSTAVCSNEGCRRQPIAKNLCARCYGFKRRHGFLKAVDDAVETKICHTKNCPNPIDCKGKCARCYAYFHKYKRLPKLSLEGDLEVYADQRKARGPSVEDLPHLREQWSRACDCYRCACGAEAMLVWRKFMKRLEEEIAQLEAKFKHDEARS